MINYTEDKIQKHHDDYKELVTVIDAMISLSSDEEKIESMRNMKAAYVRFMSILKDIQHPF